MNKPIRILIHSLGTLLAVGVIMVGVFFVVCGGSQSSLWLFSGIFGILFGIFIFVLVWKSIFRTGKRSKLENLSPKSVELVENLEKMVISTIDNVEFTPTGDPSFTLKTDNIKRLALYITEKMGKSHFEPNELSGAYDHIQKYLVSDETTGVVVNSLKLMENFVKKGGEVKVNQP